MCIRDSNCPVWITFIESYGVGHELMYNAVVTARRDPIFSFVSQDPDSDCPLTCIVIPCFKRYRFSISLSCNLPIVSWVDGSSVPLHSIPLSNFVNHKFSILTSECLLTYSP